MKRMVSNVKRRSIRGNVRIYLVKRRKVRLRSIRTNKDDNKYYKEEEEKEEYDGKRKKRKNRGRRIGMMLRSGRSVWLQQGHCQRNISAVWGFLISSGVFTLIFPVVYVFSIFYSRNPETSPKYTSMCWSNTYV